MFTRNSKRWDRKRYPANWEALSLACRVNAGNCCELCGREQDSTYISKAGNTKQIKLAACHVHPDDEANPNPELICLCIFCHGKFDALYKSAKACGTVETLKHRLIMVKRLLAMKAANSTTQQTLIDLDLSVSQLAAC
jgi:hypothetical protein